MSSSATNHECEAGMSILVVEDEDDLRDLTAMSLEGEGFQVRTARNGLEALERVREHMPALILLDIKMPVMDGWAFASEFQARYGRSAPIVVITAAEHTARRAQEIGAAGWISKPFEYADLVSTVRAHLGA